MYLLSGDGKLNIGSLPSGYLTARLHPACGAGGCLDGAGVDTIVGCAEDASVLHVPEGYVQVMAVHICLDDHF